MIEQIGRPTITRVGESDGTKRASTEYPDDREMQVSAAVDESRQDGLQVQSLGLLHRRWKGGGGEEEEEELERWRGRSLNG